MTSGNGLPAASDRGESVPCGAAPHKKQSRDDSQQLRDIQDLIAKLEVVNRQLSFPVRAMSTPRQRDASDADRPGAGD
jgi:hypothetical protein